MQNIFKKIDNQALAALFLLLGATTLQSQTFSIGNLPAGKTIIVTYEVDVNANACPTGTSPAANISNQSNVSYGPTSTTVQTHETTPLTPDPTLTPFGGLTLGNLVYKDVNKDGDYDSGTDTPVDGVNLRLYLDNGDGVLTAADGAHIATATTAGGGLYSFAVCPGNYIVEVIPSNFNAPSGPLYDGGLSAALVSSPIGGAPDPDDNVNDDDNGDPVSGFGVASQAITMAYGTEPDGADLNTNNRLDFGFKTPTTITINNVTLAEGTGGGPTAFNFTVTRSDTDAAFSLTVNTAGVTATSGSDFTAISGGTVPFTAGGSSMATVTVNVTHDNIVEANETFTVNLSGAPSGVVITDGTGDGTITNDDAATVTLTGTQSQNEGNSPAPTTDFFFTATLDNPVQGGFTIAYANNDGTATLADGDYNNNDGTINFVGTASESHNIVVQVLGDVKVEANETFTVTLGAITLAPAGVTAAGSPQTGTITNDDAATVSIAANLAQMENITPQAFSVTLSNPVDVNVTVQFNTSDITAMTGDNDYTGIVNQVVTFTAGTTTAQTVNVAVTNDNKVENNETYGVSIGTLSAGGRNVSIGSSNRTGNILNDDAATVTLTGGIAQSEGNSGTTAYTFTATLNNPVQGGFTAAYTTNDGTATTADNDYADNDGPALSFAGTASEMKTITVQVNGDLNIEANETFTVQLGILTALTTVQTNALSIAGTNPQTGTINNDEQDWGDAPTAAQSGFAGTYPTLSADNGARHSLAVGGLRLGPTVDGDLDGQPNPTATGDGADEDGVTLPSSLIIGQIAHITVNASATCKLDAWVDFNRDGDWADVGEKIFTNTSLIAGNNTPSFGVPGGASVGTSFARFRVSSAGGLAVIGLAADGEVEDYQVDILSNSYSISSPTVTEGDAGMVNLTYTISRTDNTNAGSVDYSAPTGTATSGTDYQAFASGTASFGAGGALSQNITVVVNGDMVVEDDETVVITLSNPVGGGIGTGTGTGTITNDDLATLTLTGGGSQGEGDAGTVSHIFVATLSKAVQGGFQVAYNTGGGTATAGTDYTDNDGTLTFLGNVGETKSWTVLSNGDNTVELDETFDGALGTITMTSAVQAAAISQLGSPKTATITNDDAATVSIAANVSQSEATTPQVFSVTLSNPVDVNVTVQFNTANNTATTGDNDYTGLVNQMVLFTAGSTTAQDVNVAVTNDNKVEANETYDVSIGTLSASGRSVSLGTTARTGTITNDDAATVTLTPNGGVVQNEGNSGTTNFVFTATLNNPVQDGFTLAYTTSDGTATTADNDYVDNDGPALNFAGTANEAQTITVQVNSDNKVEADETFTVALGAFGGTSLTASLSTSGSPKTGTILNDEVDWGDAPDPTYPTLSASSGASHNTVLGVRLGATIDGEANGQPNANANGDGADDDGVTLPSALVINTTANITVNTSSSGGLLQGWVDFNQNGSWESPSEQVFTNTLLLVGDNALSFSVPPGATLGTSYARFRLSGTNGLGPTGNASDGEVEDYKIEIVNTQFSIDDPMVTEGNSPGTSNLTFRISRSVNANACSVNYGITGGTATSGTDYQVFANGTASFTAGGALFQDITVTVNGDNTVELNETVVMTLNTPVNASILDGSGSGQITNDDQGIITITNATVTEGDAGFVNATFDITMSNPSDANVVFGFAAQDGTATFVNQDYQATGSTHTLTPGQTMKQVMVPVNGDCAIEANETFLMRLASLNPNSRDIIFSGGGATLDGTGTITNDDALPVITCGGNISQNAAAGVCNANVTLPLPTTSSLCGSSVLDFHYRTVDAANAPTGPFSAYSPAANNTVNFAVNRYEIEWRVTDGSGSSSCSYYLDLVDNEPPTVACPAATTTINTDAGASCTITIPNYVASLTPTDNCSGVITESQTIPAGSYSTGVLHGAVITVMYTATDAAGKFITCTVAITVNDDDLPSITCPANMVRSTDANLCTAVVTYTMPTATDNCSSPIPTLVPPSLASGSAFPKGVNNVEWKATDAANNAKTCAFTITVNDAQKPTITCPANKTQGTDPGECEADVTYLTPTATDNCNPAPTVMHISGGTGHITGSPNSSATFQKGVTTVTWKATDDSGNTKTCTFKITVNDLEKPMMTCLIDINANNDAGLCSAVVTYTLPTFTDNCPPTSGQSVKISGPASGSAFSVGTSNVVYRATDASGNTKQCTLKVIVTDNQPPTIGCPGPIVVTGSGTPCKGVAVYSTPTASDNCSGSLTPFLLSGLASGSQFPAGVTTNTWRAIAGNGQSTDCSFTVTVDCPDGMVDDGWDDGQKGQAFQVSETWNVSEPALSMRLVPNPATTQVEIWVGGTGSERLGIEEAGEAAGRDLSVFDAQGRMVWQRTLEIGEEMVLFDFATKNLADGLYFVMLRSEGAVLTKRLVVSRQ